MGGVAVNGQYIIVFGTSTTADTVHSLTSQDFSCIAQVDDLGRVGSRVRGTLMPVCRKQMSIFVQQALLPGQEPHSRTTLCWSKMMLCPTDQAPGDFLENQDVEVIDGHPKSPEMKSMEHIWDQVPIHIHDVANTQTTAAQSIECGCPAGLGCLAAGMT